MLDALGVQVLVPDSCIGRWKMEPGQQIQREVHRHGLHQAAPWDRASGDLREWGPTAWFDWNPTKRCELPEFVPKVAAGVPAPLQLTPWKVGALKVLADLELDGFTTAKGVRAHGIYVFFGELRLVGSRGSAPSRILRFGQYLKGVAHLLP